MAADEMWLKAKKRWFYLYVVIDSNNNLLALRISENRSRQVAIAVLKKARWIVGFIPSIIVTDEWNAYPRSISKVFGRVRLNM